MTSNIKKINIIGAIICLAIICTFIIVGSFSDYQISVALYKPDNPSLMGIIGSILAQAPTFLGVTFAGALLVVISTNPKYKQNKKYGVIFLIVGISGIAFGTFFSFYYALKLKDFVNIGTGLTYYLSLAAILVICLGINALIVVFTLKRKARLEYKRVFLVASFIILVVGIEIILYQGLKFIISRPRPRYIFADSEPLRLFENWWSLHPFAALKNDELKSCPSGHACNAMALPFVLVGLSYLRKDNSDSARLVLFIFGFLYAVAWSFTRVLAGAHFFSDIGLGMLISFITGLVIWNFYIKKYKINENKVQVLEENKAEER